MKIFLSLLIIVFTIKTGFCQDKIFTKNKGQLDVQILEKTDKLVRYKMPDYENGPVISMKNNQISKIEYKNGVVDLMSSQNPRINKPLGINIGLTDRLGTLTVNYFIIPKIEMELSYGTNFDDVPYYAFGARVHIDSDDSSRRFTPFSGLLIGSKYSDAFLILPIGINYATKSGLNASLSINNILNVLDHSINYYDRTLIPFSELRIGWRFKV